MTFAIVAAAIISGAVVERIRFSSYALFIVVWVLAVYVPLCNWIWGGGWIAELGAKDFAGGTVVHISSGTSAFALASLLGERKHRAESFPSNLPFVILGGGILWLGQGPGTPLQCAPCHFSKPLAKRQEDQQTKWTCTLPQLKL